MAELDIFNPTLDENLGNVLSLSPPPDPSEFDDPSLFKSLTDFIDDNCENGHSPIYEYLSTDSEFSEIDVENSDDTLLKCNEAGDDELVNYLTKRENKSSTVAFQPFNSNVVEQKKKNVTKISVMPLVTNKTKFSNNANINKPVVISGNHSVVRIPSSNIQELNNNNIRLIKRIEIRKAGGPARCSSPTESEISNKSQSLSKSAIAARENRQKKKHYIEQLEKNVKKLGTENKAFKGHVQDLESEVDSLRKEVLYLKSVLANESTLSKLLQNIPGISGVRLKTSEFSSGISNIKKRSFRDEEDDESPVDRVEMKSGDFSEESSRHGTRSNSKKQKLDHDYASSNSFVQKSFSGYPKKKPMKPVSMPGGGVCLHVADGEASLEFCAECSRRASSGKGSVH